MDSRLLRAIGPATLVTVAVVVMVASLAYGGGAAPLVIADAGPVVRWGLPTTTLIFNLAAAGLLGSLILALFALKAGDRAFDVALDVASVSAAVFTVAAGVTGFFTFIDAFNAQVTLGPEFGAQFGKQVHALADHVVIVDRPWIGLASGPYEHARIILGA